MSDADTQRDLDAAQADLEAKVGQLKDIVTEKVDAVKRPVEWLADNAWLLMVTGGLGIALISALRGD
jgi:hypothetical protein